MVRSLVGTRLFAAALALSPALLASASSVAQVTTERLTSNLLRPTWAGAPPGDSRIFIAQKRGIVMLLNGGVLSTFLNITSQVADVGEQGFFSVAFDPGFANNGFFYVDYTENSGDTVIARYTVSAGNPNIADLGSVMTVVGVVQPTPSHNGGCLQFGPDGYLYFSLGDGTTDFDPDCNGQRLDTLLGGISRIDVSSLPYSIPPDNPFIGTPSAAPELWHYGLRNPWRFWIDPLTSDMFIGDVGENEREEISAALAGASGINFGWKTLEGTRCVFGANVSCSVPDCTDPGYEPPIYELDHTEGVQSVTGGIVYRGTIDCEYGNYYFADFSDSKIRSLRYDAVNGVTNFADRTAEFAPGGGMTIENIVSFGVDGSNELLLVDYGTGSFNGEVYRMIPRMDAASSASIFNGTGVNPACFSPLNTPVLGQPWQIEVDVTSEPTATFSFVFASNQPRNGLILAIGELLVGDTQLYVSFQATSGTTDLYQPLVPCDPAFLGFTGYFQAGILSPGATQLCNRVDATVGNF